MPRISIRPDGRGGHAVYSGGVLLIGGLGEDEAQNFAAFFRAAERIRGGRTGQAPLCAAAASGPGRPARTLASRP